MSSTAATQAHPVRVDASLDAPLSRWLWLVKWWLLAIPQYIIIGLFTGANQGSWWGWRLGYSHGVLSIAYQGLGAAFGGPMNNAHQGGWGNTHTHTHEKLHNG